MKILTAMLRAIATFVIVMMAAVFALGPRLDKRDDQERALERLKRDYVFKKSQAINLDAYRVQNREAEALLDRASAMLPMTFGGQSERLAAAAQRHHVSLKQSAPGPEAVREFYSVRGVRISAVGRYHDLGAFAAELDGAPGCLRLRDLSLHPESGSGRVRMEALVWAFRYLDDAEVEKRRREAVGEAKS